MSVVVRIRISETIPLGRDSSVGTAARYGLEGPEIESRCGRPWGPPSLLYNGYRVFPGVKRPRRDVDHPPHLAPKLKKE